MRIRSDSNTYFHNELKKASLYLMVLNILFSLSFSIKLVVRARLGDHNHPSGSWGLPTMHWEGHFSPLLFVFCPASLRSSFLFPLIYWLVTADLGSVGCLFLFLSRVVASSPDSIKHLQVSLMNCSCMNPACVCRTIKLWDLEKFTMIGSLEGDTTPVRWVFPVVAGCYWNVTSNLWPLSLWFQVYMFQPRWLLPVQRRHGLAAGLRLGAGPLLRRGVGGLGEGFWRRHLQPAAGV